jgi:hypothetical protein
VGGYDAVVLQKKNRAELLRHSLARRSPKRGEIIDRVYFHGKSATEVAEIVGVAEAGSLPRRPLTALPHGAVYGGAKGAGLIFFSFFFLGLLLFHSLISLPPHFFEVIGSRITRSPWQPVWFFHDLSSPFRP